MERGIDNWGREQTMVLGKVVGRREAWVWATERIPGTEWEFGTPRGLEQSAWERLPGRMVQGDVHRVLAVRID